MKYMEGEWTYEWPDLPEKGTTSWRTVTAGYATIGRTVEADGDRSVELGGWRSDTKTLVFVGHVTDGGYWHLEYTEIDDKGARGTVKGVLPDGRSFDGTYALVIIDDDRFEGRLTAVADGEKLNAVGRFTRKKD